MKKVMVVFLSLFFSIAVVQAEPEKCDKFDEWCNKLNLTPQQLKKLSRCLQDISSLLSEDKIKKYRDALADGSTLDIFHYLKTMDEDAQKVLHIQEVLKREPLISKSIVQLSLLVGVNVMYRIPDELWPLLLNENEYNEAKSTISDDEIFSYLPRVKKDVEMCQLCTKKKVLDAKIKKREEENNKK
jgi:hypothetical protein